MKRRAGFISAFPLSGCWLDRPGKEHAESDCPRFGLSVICCRVEESHSATPWLGGYVGFIIAKLLEAQGQLSHLSEIRQKCPSGPSSRQDLPHESEYTNSPHNPAGMPISHRRGYPLIEHSVTLTVQTDSGSTFPLSNVPHWRDDLFSRGCKVVVRCLPGAVGYSSVFGLCTFAQLSSI